MDDYTKLVESELALYKTWARAVVKSLEPLRPHAENLGVTLGGWLHDAIPPLVAEYERLLAKEKKDVS